jgi:hypothetical protein
LAAAIVAAGLGVAQVCSASASASGSVHGELAAFRTAAEEYRGFIIPHCAPEQVDAYNQAHAARDTDFARSIEHTPLDRIYRRAARDVAEQSSRTIYECMGPPPPPIDPHLSDAERRRIEHERDAAASKDREENRLGYSRHGDELFATLIAARDRALRRKEK